MAFVIENCDRFMVDHNFWPSLWPIGKNFDRKNWHKFQVQFTTDNLSFVTDSRSKGESFDLIVTDRSQSIRDNLDPFYLIVTWFWFLIEFGRKFSITHNRLCFAGHNLHPLWPKSQKIGRNIFSTECFGHKLVVNVFLTKFFGHKFGLKLFVTDFSVANLVAKNSNWLSVSHKCRSQRVTDRSQINFDQLFHDRLLSVTISVTIDKFGHNL